MSATVVGVICVVTVFRQSGPSVSLRSQAFYHVPSLLHALIVGFDLFPTFTEIAGLSNNNPANLDGASFKAHLLEQQDFPDRDIFFGYEPKLGTAMRRGDWKMIIKEDKVQLFNLQKDPRESNDLAAQHPEITKSMEQAIDRFKTEVTPGS